MLKAVEVLRRIPPACPSASEGRSATMLASANCRYYSSEVMTSGSWGWDADVLGVVCQPISIVCVMPKRHRRLHAVAQPYRYLRPLNTRCAPWSARVQAKPAASPFTATGILPRISKLCPGGQSGPGKSRPGVTPYVAIPAGPIAPLSPYIYPTPVWRSELPH